MPPKNQYRQKIRDIRPFSRPNQDGSYSTVLLEQRDNYAYPTLFPVDLNNPESGWMELKGDEAFREAVKRNEVFEFDSEREAMKFAEGSWKNLEEKISPRSVKDIMKKSDLANAFTKPISTGAAHDSINNLISKEKIEPSLLNFIRGSISTKKGIKPEDTSYGRAIAQLVKEYGSPVIKGKKEPEFINLSGDENYRALYSRDRRIFPPFFGKGNWPSDTVKAQYGDIEGLIAELSHVKQFGKNPLKRLLTEGKSVWQYEPDMSHYITPGTVEYEAHQEIQPEVQERFNAILDSLSRGSANKKSKGLDFLKNITR